MSDPGRVVTVRPMTAADVPGAEVVWFEAFDAMRIAAGVGREPRTDASIDRYQARLRHVLGTDPECSWVAEAAGAVIGLAQALVRDRLWVLSLLAVSPSVQQRHIGKRLLESSVQSFPRDGFGMIFSSPDPRAMRRYTLAGFDLHPSMAASGLVRPGALTLSGGIRTGSVEDRPFVDEIDRVVRGSAHGADIDNALREGCTLFVLDGEGYAVARGGSPVVVAGRTDRAASALLTACLLNGRDDETVEVRWLTSGQQWAVRTALRAGLVLRPMGPVMTKGMAGPPLHYVPSGAYG
jgi:ribosomal protein S18 acetylase RimI-like enzyme